MRSGLFAASAALLLSIAAAPAPRAAEPLSAEQRQEIESIVRDYIRQHPEILIESLQSAEEKLEAEKESRAKGALAERRRDLMEDAAAPVGGNPQGNVTVVEFFDYRCPYCKQVHPAIVQLLGEDKQIRFVYKEFPILGKDSTYAGRAALAAFRQGIGKYESFHNALMALKGQLSEETVLKTASSVGLDVDQLKGDMGRGEIDDALKRTNALARALDIRGTPAFVIGDKLLPGAVDVATLKKSVAEARKSE
jgi:protein-disulfide isomerase